MILISIDTLRADHLSAYGYKAIQTPNVDAFAERGTRFAAVNSQIPLTLPSHTALFTSTYPFESGVEENGQIVPAALPTLAWALQQNGYRTGAFIGSDLLAQRYKLDKGFDVYDCPFRVAGGEAENPYDVRVRRDAALVIRGAAQWLRSGGDKPAFAFLHFFDLHAPYMNAKAKGLQPNAAGYDQEILHVDLLMGKFRQFLVEKGWWDRALVIVVSDHGESLGEHGETSHGFFAYESTLWVPLLIHWPKGMQPLPGVVEQAAGLTDVAPTILDFLHVAAPASFHGGSLLKQTKHPVYSESVYAHDAFGWSPLRGLRTEDFQYVDAPSAELYQLKQDPQERKNVIQSHAEVAREMRTRLKGLLASAPVRAPAARESSAQTDKTLRSLGYVTAGSAGVSANGGVDPKSRLAEYQAYESGLEALYSNREEQAIAILSNVVKRDAANTSARFYMGEAYLRMNRREDALREWKAALAQDPGYEPAVEAIQRVTNAKR